MKRIGFLARTYQRAQHLIRTDTIVGEADLVPLSVLSMGHRGREFDAIVVDSELWPLDRKIAGEYGPCLSASEGHFYVRA